jgi:hypothetical protein
MFGISFVRVASVTAAFFVASFISFPSFPSSGLLSLTPSISINREFKGDRLPLVAPSPAETRRELGMRAPPSESQSRESAGRLRQRLQSGRGAAARQRVSPLHGLIFGVPNSFRRFFGNVAVRMLVETLGENLN